MKSAVVVIFLFFIAGGILIFFYFWLLKRINIGAQRLSNKRIKAFNILSRKYGFKFENSLNPTLINNLKIFYLMSNKQFNPPVNAVLERKLLSNAPQNYWNIHSKKVKNGSWYIFDYSVTFGYGSDANPERCTVFLRTYNDKRFSKIAAFRRSVFDFAEFLKLNPIKLSAVKLESSKINRHYRIFADKPNKDYLTKVLLHLMNSYYDLNLEIDTNMCIIYTSLRGYAILEDNKLEEVFAHLQELFP